MLRSLFLLFTSLFLYSLSAQDVMLQGWYWDYPKPNCNGAPVSTPHWATVLGNQAATLGQAGFTYVWLPPASRASFGSCSNGYDPKDLYDLGDSGVATGFGTRTEVDATIAALAGQGIKSVADVIYNHRDGGDPETNPAVKAYIEEHFTGQMSGGLTQQPYPSDRFRCRLPIGGSATGAGHYYIKISSKTQNFGPYVYKFRGTVASTGFGYTNTIDETEPNGGGDCGQGNNILNLDQEVRATLWDWSGCYTDEFEIVLSPSDFAAAGDDFMFFLNNEGGYSDHRIYGIHYDEDGAGPIPGYNLDMTNLVYETFTSFPGPGAMNFENFKPNSANAASTFLAGDWDSKLFFYDYDQYSASTQSVLNDWTYWLHNVVGIDGMRMDAVKHFDPAFVAQMLDDMEGRGWTPSMVVGELFDTNPTALANWVTAVDQLVGSSTALVRIFDFSLRAALKEACDNGSYDKRNLFNSSIRDATALEGFNVVTFVNNHDYRDEGQPVQNDPLLAYVYTLTNNQIGLPTVFYPDYFGTSIPHAPTVNIQSEINELISLQQDFIAGSPNVEYLNRFGTPRNANYIAGAAEDVVIYQLPGGVAGRSVVVAINFGYSQLRVDQEIDLQGTVVSGTQFTDQTANANFPTVNVGNGGGVNNRIYIDLPARSYAVYVQDLVAAPVELISFSTSAGRTGEVNLHWETALEEALSHFEVECAQRAEGPFTTVARADARQLPSQYSMVDARPWTSPQRYYRLKTLELDGTYSYSALEMEERVTPAEVQIFPQPANEEIQVIGITAGINWEIVDVTGKRVKQGTSSSDQQFRIPLSDLSTGIYLFKTEQSQLRRLIINR